MKNLTASIFLALITMSAAFSDSTITFKCTLDPSQASQDFKITSLTFSFNQSASSISYLAGSLVSIPADTTLKLINTDTKTASDIDGTAAATDASNDLVINGQNTKTNMAMLLAMAAPVNGAERRTDIDVYPTSPSNYNQVPEKEGHFLCSQTH
jgi:hypothetical protein